MRVDTWTLQYLMIPANVGDVGVLLKDTHA